MLVSRASRSISLSPQRIVREQLKFLNSLVSGICHIKKAFAIHRHAVRIYKLPGLVTSAANANQESPFWRKALDTIVQTANPNALISIDEHSNWSEGELRESCLQSTETARFVILVSPCQQRLAIERELLNTAMHTFCRIDPALTVNR